MCTYMYVTSYTISYPIPDLHGTWRMRSGNDTARPAAALRARMCGSKITSRRKLWLGSWIWPNKEILCLASRVWWHFPHTQCVRCLIADRSIGRELRPEIRGTQVSPCLTIKLQHGVELRVARRGPNKLFQSLPSARFAGMWPASIISYYGSHKPSHLILVVKRLCSVLLLALLSSLCLTKKINAGFEMIYKYYVSSVYPYPPPLFQYCFSVQVSWAVQYSLWGERV